MPINPSTAALVEAAAAGGNGRSKKEGRRGVPGEVCSTVFHLIHFHGANSSGVAVVGPEAPGIKYSCVLEVYI